MQKKGDYLIARNKNIIEKIINFNLYVKSSRNIFS